MKCLFFLFSILVSHTAWSQGEPQPMPGIGIMMSGVIVAPPECSKEALRGRAARIARSYADEDMTKSYQSIEAYLARCKKTGSQFGLDMPHLQNLVKVSQQKAFERTRDEIEYAAKFGKVDELAKRYREQAAALGMSSAEIEAFLTPLEKLGIQSFQKEQASCKPVDMSAELGPVRDQDSLGWCYAFAASDLLSYKTKQRISAADIALTYNKNFENDISRVMGAKESSFEGGVFRSAIAAATEKGLCLEKDLPSEDNANANLETNLNLIDKLRRGSDRKNALACAEVRTAAKALFPNLDFDDVRKIALTTVDKDIVQKMADKSCQKRIKVDAQVESVASWDKQEIAEGIDKNLDQTNPVAIAYDAEVLSFPKSKYGVPNHGSVIAGRRFNEKTGQCEYLLRNSWGRGCFSYHSGYECKDGQIWIPKPSLIKATMNVISIK
ncbi:C1 family peptidase [Bdellovibrio sp. HCB2-146]|uniref:C1 family peptidase n=1 Tax=Bdellovibrio sp. HCB2-146 TaxID=3394362 RepID=UPI0039BC9016